VTIDVTSEARYNPQLQTNSDADTCCYSESMGVNGKGLRKTVNDLLCNPVRIFYCIQVRKNQRKLVASQASNSITLPQHCAQAFCRCFEKEIPHTVMLWTGFLRVRRTIQKLYSRTGFQHERER
jgi:hypothetical protein